MNIVEHLSANFSRFTLGETEQSIAERFEKIALLYGGRLAITDANSSITYGALNQLANRMARNILSVAPAEEPVRIAVFMEKGIQNIAAILAVLKCGHAYVPIDPEFPEERNRHIYRESGAALLVTNTNSRAAAAKLAGDTARILDLDGIPESTNSDNLDVDISPDALAYIIYTSGSTGRPKGVVQNQRNVLHGCMRRTNLQKVIPQDRMTLFYSCSVIASVYCIFGALLNGASLFPYDFRTDGVEKLANWLRSRRITIYHSVASVFREFARSYQGADDVFDVRLVIFGGERVLTSDVELARKVFSRKIAFYTGLGSTETGTMRYFPIDEDTEIDEEVVPIGYPVEGIDVLLLDEEGNEVAAGEVGEIAVRSRYVALGYWKNSEASEKAFYSDPKDPDVRIYRTGDLGQMEQDGLLRHRGRKDFQVKIRGFRVEVSEVEANLIDHPAISEAVVVARDLRGETQLVAYIVPAEGELVTVQGLRNYLADRLTYYMIPTVVVCLDQLPKTPNNKVDRNALPEPDEKNILATETRVPPQGATESQLVEFAREVLDREDIGTNQNFFDLGGHSLRAMQLLARIREHFAADLSVRAIFEARDFKDLATAIDAAPPLSEDSQPEFIHAPETARLPLSSAQTRMWLADQLYGGGAAYNISNTVYLEGELNLPALEEAIGQIVSRHSILRTRFPSDEAGPRQEILPADAFELNVIDLRAMAKAERAKRAMQICRRLLEARQDLADGPLFCSTLVRVGERAAVLALVFNHIIYDNIWSSAIFFRELAHLYGALSQGHAASLPPLEFQFVDYAYWEQSQAQSPSQAKQLAFWRDQLSGAPETLDLPADHPPQGKPDFSGGIVRFKLPTAPWAAARTVAKQESVTGFMVLLAVWQLLLHRYSGQDDILVGTPTGRRPLTQTEDMIGLFINTLVLRTDFSSAPGFRELLAQVRATTIDAFSNDQVPFERVVADLNPDRRGGTAPLFQHLFIHRQMEGDQWQLPGLQVKPLEIHSGGSKFDLTLSVLEKADEVACTIEYRRARFERQTIERMSQHFTQLLEGAVTAPDCPVGELPMIGAAERCKLREQVQRTARTLPVQETTAQLFERVATLRSEEIAVIAGTEQLTYSALNRAANALARDLIDRGLKPGQLVAVCIDREISMVSALLAVWKAGGAYVPLDPHFPAERLSYMLEDSGAGFLITAAALRDRFSDFSGEVLQPPEPDEVLARDRCRNLQPLAGGNDLAYVIYTSGSTGRPKGVEITHRSLVNFLCAMQKEPSFSADDRLLAVTTLCFDIAMLEIFLPLISGGSVVIQDRRGCMDPQKIREAIEKHNISVMQATPATWRMLLDFGWQGEPSVRVFCGGEAMGEDLAASLLERGLEVWNLYGPTETTIWSAAGRIRAPAEARFVGAPIANTRLYVLNSAGASQPAGVPGELCIGGAGLARGYRNREELTREKFFSSELDPHGRLYRTGDLVVQRLDGRLEFLGRIDHQVKIRGFRVELGEIESALLGDDIRRAVVIAHNDDFGSQYLAAYLIPVDGAKIDITALRTRLRQTLPEYMVPAHFVTLDAFPMTANGKVDRKAFPPPSDNAAAGQDPQPQTQTPPDSEPAGPAPIKVKVQQPRKAPAPEHSKSTVTPSKEQPKKTVLREPEAEVEPPQQTAVKQTREIVGVDAVPNNPPGKATPSPVEDVVRAVFRDVLKVPIESDEASFFDLGGHSLAAIHAIARLNQHFGLSLPPTLLFDFASIRQLSSAITAFREGQSEQEVMEQASLDEATSRQVDAILEAVKEKKDALDMPDFPHGMKMRESPFARKWLAPLFAIRSGFLRILLQKLILKLEGGSTFSVTMRKLYRQHYDIHVADFSSVPFEPTRLKRTTRIGKYCTIYRTVNFQNADHPRNTLSTHGLFYSRGLGFSTGYELDRVTIEVGNDVWIGDGAKILYPTRKIGDGAVIAAGAVVVEDVPPYAIVAGYPAQVVRYRFSRETIAKLESLKWWEMSDRNLFHARGEFLRPLEGDRVH
ncbi:Linear gramicidin synthase subunit D [Microbulbifer aggregans]|uniref:Linear gramicidin synthase subunit D n=1 Tax=Microbulbifer aggregans TaxID=1769779 RepID=A0A1C9W5Q2_9GAMM|nr:non-ribosomal peptide synthetase [Microbulbifer aggregans]AOS96478.1 Linear gramicidin synthase subunit D [Microbulbifer aggregans]